VAVVLNPDIAQLNATETKFITVCFNTSASEDFIVSQWDVRRYEPFFQRLGVDGGGRVLGSQAAERGRRTGVIGVCLISL